MEKPELVVLYASQTGNAQDVAERIAREAERQHYNVLLMSMDAYSLSELPNESLVIFVVSTTGQGDPPDSMKSFWKLLLRRELHPNWLKGLPYAVFGLGDSGYLKYNIVAKKLDRRLFDLGGTAIIERGLGDDQHPSGYEATLDPWLTSLWKVIGEQSALGTPSAVNSVSKIEELDPPKFHVTYHKPITEAPSQDSDAKRKLMEMKMVRDMMRSTERAAKPFIEEQSFGYSLDQPFLARVILNERLTDEDHEQDVRDIAFDIRDSGIDYVPGDVLAVMPCQDEKNVTAFLKRCSLDPDAYISVETAKYQDQPSSMEKRIPVMIRSIFESVLDVSSASVRRYFFEVMSHFATAEHEKDRLRYFASPEGRDDLYQYNQRERRTVLEVLEDFPSVCLPLEWLLQLVPRLQPRYFSISSSMLVHPHELHITVAAVSWMTPFKRRRYGLCSTWLSKIDPGQGILVPVWKKEGSLKLPPPTVPLILVGPGTGCAPFRAFIEERASLSTSIPVAPILFFFGCRKEKKDFLYRDFWLHEAKTGVLSEQFGGGFFVAFSRDQPHKVYVQHKIKEAGGKVWNFLRSGCSIYVAGSANKMPADVAVAFEEVLVQQSSIPRDVAQRWLKQLEKAGKYHVEVWS